MSRGVLDRRLSHLDYQIGAARASVETAYALDLHESHKEAAWSHLVALLRERTALRLRWAANVDHGPDRIVAGEGLALLAAELTEEEIPIYDPETLIW